MTRRGTLHRIVPLLLMVAAGGCNKRVSLPLVENQRPVVTLSQAPVGGSNRYFYSYEMRWSGYDPDGRVDHFDYVVDPPTAAGAETTWIHTSENRKSLEFRSGDPDSLGDKVRPGGYHVFVIRAVDDRGLPSEPVARAFNSYTFAPDVRITSPQPNHLIYPLVPPSAVVSWTGHDVDGQHSLLPVKYKFKLFKQGASEFDVLTMALDPDSLRRYYAPGFPGWDSTTTDTFTTLRDLIPESKYVFVVVAFDEAGAYSTIFNFDINMLYFQVGFVNANGPKITMYNNSFSYSYVSGGYYNDPRRYVSLEVAADTPVDLYWYGTPGAYSSMKQYRWAMDIQRLDDDTPRSGPLDYRHWSAAALSNTFARVGPFSGVSDSVHNFFIEAEDNNGLKSLGIVSIRVVRPTFQNQLLFVNDTRFQLDQGIGLDTVRTALGQWPCEAELDTFFYARGGMPWRQYPPGSVSPPGIFLGYDPDTVATYRLVGNVVSLATLARYRHVVWMTNATEAFGVYLPTLQAMSSPGSLNTLATYVQMGGRLWLMGGGAARATLMPYNSHANDTGPTVFSPSQGELVPGRFMYDLVRWRSEISGYYAIRATLNPKPSTAPDATDLTGLPALLTYRTPATDPLPPLRNDDFYVFGYDAEYLSLPNSILEEVDVTPDSTTRVAVLDTLYFTNGGSPGTKPVMTLYRGHEGAPVLFSGFPLWYFSRSQAMAVGDWVLQTLWNLPRQPLPRDPGSVPLARASRRR